MLLLALTGSIATGKSTTARILTSAPYSLPLLDADVIAREVIEPGTSAYWRIREEFEASTPGLLLEDDASGESSQEEGSNVRKGSQNQSEESKRRSQSWISWFSSLPSALFSLLSTKPPLQNPSSPLPRINRATLGRCVFGSSPSATSRRHTLNSIIHPSVRFRLLASILKHYLGGTRVLLLDIPLLYESSLDILAGYILFVAASPEVQKRRLLVRDRAMGKEISEEEAEGRIASQVAVREKVEWMEEMMGRKRGGDGGGGGGEGCGGQSCGMMGREKRN